MLEIRPIRPTEITQAKHLIYEVAFQIFHNELPLEEGIPYYEARGELRDMDDIQRNYFENGGTFLVMAEGDYLLGTGALRRMEHEVCELKRLWFRVSVQGKGYGYQMIQTLFTLARERGYRKMRLSTDKIFQTRAVAFYQRLGFYEIPPYDHNEPEDIAMEIVL